MKRLTFITAAFAITFATLTGLSGCGQSGKLYIPGDPSQMAVPPSRETADADAEEQEEDSGETPESD
jgi:predicted small lipoprotein YifL